MGWIVGFVDGEGTFSVTVMRNKEMSLGWQVFPEFVVTQGEKSLPALNQLREFFGCGRIFRNKRKDNHREDLFRYCVRNMTDLRSKIIPFFNEHELRTAKKEDFSKFARVISLIHEGEHLNWEGVRKIARITQTMNRKKPSKFLLEDLARRSRDRENRENHS